MNNKIEKGKWQIGMTKDYKGVIYEVSGFNPNGTPLWKKKDANSSKQPTSAPASSTQTISPKPATSASTSGSTASTTPTPTPKPKQAVSYDAPKPKVVYKDRPAKEIEVEAQVPEHFRLKKVSTGKIEDADRSVYRKVYGNLPDDKLLKIVNAQNLAWELRTIAWEEAQARGIDEKEINTSGSLKNRWKSLKREYDFANPEENEDDNLADYASTNDAIFNTFDYDKVKDEFPEGDTGWEDPNDKRIQRNFNGLSTKMDRRKYDAFLDKRKREERFYETPEQTLQRLGREMLGFVRGERPLFISSGGAGAGKTTKFRELAEATGMKEYTPPDPDTGYPGSGEDEYDYVVVPKDVENEKDFAALLDKHNGKVIVFDDKDRLLVSDANKIVGMMKALADSNPKNRKFEHNGQEKKFTGKLLFITNKTPDVLAKDEDHKAILSRATHNDIHFTNAENLEILGQRYKTMGKIAALADNPDLDEQIRQEVYDLILERADRLDPKKFTVRKFEEILEKISGDLESEKVSKQSSSLKRMLGAGKLNLEAIVERELNKGEISERLEAEFSSLGDDMKKEYKRLYKKDPKKFIELFGDEIIDFINEEGDYEVIEEEDVTKSFEDEIGRMSLDKAEELLLG